MDTQKFVANFGMQHLGSNIRRYKSISWLGEEKKGTFGQFVAIAPVTGKFIHNDGELTLFKTGTALFHVVATALLPVSFQPDDKVSLEFYKLKGFDGLAPDGSEDPADISDGIRSITFMLTGGVVHIPAKWDGRHIQRKANVTKDWATIQNPYLIDMIGQLEGLKVSSYRNLATVLVDANASVPTFVDPPEEESCSEDKTKWPSITTQLNCAKFKGQFTLRYDRACDTYEILLAHDDGRTDLLEDVHFPDLSTIFAARIDDDSWKQVKATLLKAAPKKKAIAA